MPGGNHGTDAGTDRGLSVKSRPEVKKPRQYRVIMFNDDYTTRDFVVDMLVGVFKKPVAEATVIMMDVHRKGRGVVGVYSYDIAMSRVNRVHTLAREAGFPFRCDVEEA